MQTIECFGTTNKRSSLSEFHEGRSFCFDNVKRTLSVFCVSSHNSMAKCVSVCSRFPSWRDCCCLSKKKGVSGSSPVGVPLTFDNNPFNFRKVGDFSEARTSSSCLPVGIE